MRRSFRVVSWLLLFGSSVAYGQFDQVDHLHRLINEHRERIGCQPLAWHTSAARVAQLRSADMDHRNYFDHESPEGSTFIQELEKAGINTWSSVGENIALTQAGPESAIELWLDSRPHRRNLENCAYTHQAIGESSGYWTQILLAEPNSARQDSVADDGS